MAKIKVREMAHVECGSKIYSEASVKRYAEKLVNLLYGHFYMRPSGKMTADDNKFWKIKSKFEKSGIITNEELCALAMMKSKFIK